MVEERAIRLLVDDPSVLASLQFSLSVEGFKIENNNLASLIVDERYCGNGVTVLEELRAQGVIAPAIVLATHPNLQLRNRIAACGAMLVEKPLMGDEISHALRDHLQSRKAA